MIKSSYPSYKNINLKNKVVLLRVDLNSPISQGKVELSKRILEHIKTIKQIKQKKAKLVVLAHQGRKGGEDFTNLEAHAKMIGKYTAIKYIPDIVGEKAKEAILNLKAGKAILLENLRFLDEEKYPPKNIKDNKIVMALAPLADVYINDAFSNCHRAHTSMSEFPKVLPSYAGPVLEKELTALAKFDKINHPAVFIFGGAKPEEPMNLINSRKDIDYILCCGLFGQNCLTSQGFDFGAQSEYLKGRGILPNNRLKQMIKKYNMKTPVDFGVKNNNKRLELKLNQFPSEYEIYDIGQDTIDAYVAIIKKAKTIFLKGTPGSFEDKNFRKGTLALLNAIASSKAYSFVGGGHTSDAILEFKIKGFNHICLSGGAMLNYLSKKKLPGLEALKKAPKVNKLKIKVHI
ncbi:MAG: phosphoglycerate kinase [Candidatus Nanohalarchaeota archaeon]|nr:MAG: phosphoglycerate kinase [Candidatus Nanohaloarchaeota archaeon]